MSDDEALVRRAIAADARAIAELQVGSWRVAYREILPAALLAGLSVADGTERRHSQLSEPTPGVTNWVATLDEDVVGWAASGPSREADLPPGTLELYALYVHPDQVGRGHGRALMQRALADARDRGAPCMTLWVLSENARARAFYGQAGFAVDPQAPEVAFDDTDALKLRMRRAL